MAGGGTQQSIRKCLGALKDTTTVNLAKVNSDYKELDIAIVKATNHDEHPAKEKYTKEIFRHISDGRPRADVAYCIRALARRLSKTHNWAVALKTLIVIHRALREVGSTFREELISYGRSSSHMLHLSYFKDDSSAEAWDYSAWVRNYALFLEEKVECLRVLKYDIERDPMKTFDLNTVDVLDHLPAVQQLLFRLLGCQPQGASSYNPIIQHAISMVAQESFSIHIAISKGTVNMVDKFFDMHRDNAMRALDIYTRAINQAAQLSEFYEVCKTMHIERGEKFPRIDQPPASFLQTMEQYVRDAPLALTAERDQAVPVIENKTKPEVEEATSSPPPPVPASEPESVKEESPMAEPTDLLGMNESTPDTSEIDQKNALALAIVQPADSSSTENGATSWELALVGAPSSNESAMTSRILAGGLDLLTLDSLYDEANRRANQTACYNPWEAIPASGPMTQPPVHDPFYASNTIAAPQTVQMVAMGQQQQAFMLQQQQMMTIAAPQVHQASTNPFGNPYMPASYSQGMQVQADNTYTGTGLI